MKTNNAIRGVFFLVLVTTMVFAQDHDGRFNGQVTGPFDGLVADAPLRAIHIASGDSWQSRTDTDGYYEFVNLPAGEYRLQVRIPCCEYLPYQSDPFALPNGAARTIDIKLEQGFQLNTIGDVVSVSGYRARDGSNRGNVASITLADGREMTGNTSRYK